eukprot:scaffold98278_cov38-Phaeocystis_antarctica.AAC.1
MSTLCATRLLLPSLHFSSATRLLLPSLRSPSRDLPRGCRGGPTLRTCTMCPCGYGSRTSCLGHVGLQATCMELQAGAARFQAAVAHLWTSPARGCKGCQPPRDRTTSGGSYPWTRWHAPGEHSSRVARE